MSPGVGKSGSSSVLITAGECVESEDVCVNEAVWLVSSVVMDHLNTSCCIHVGRELCCVQVRSEKSATGAKAVGSISNQVTRKARFDVQRVVVCSFVASNMSTNDDDDMTHGS